MNCVNEQHKVSIKKFHCQIFYCLYQCEANFILKGQNTISHQLKLSHTSAIYPKKTNKKWRVIGQECIDHFGNLIN